MCWTEAFRGAETVNDVAGLKCQRCSLPDTATQGPYQYISSSRLRNTDVAFTIRHATSCPFQRRKGAGTRSSTTSDVGNCQLGDIGQSSQLSRNATNCVHSARNGELPFPVSEYTAIFGRPVGRTLLNAVAAGGTGSRQNCNCVATERPEDLPKLKVRRTKTKIRIRRLTDRFLYNPNSVAIWGNPPPGHPMGVFANCGGSISSECCRQRF